MWQLELTKYIYLRLFMISRTSSAARRCLHFGSESITSGLKRFNENMTFILNKKLIKRFTYGMHPDFHSLGFPTLKRKM